MSTAFFATRNSPDGTNGHRRINSEENFKENATKVDIERENRKAALKRKELRLNYVFYLPMLVLDLLIIALTSWDASPQVQKKFFTDGNGPIAPFCMLGSAVLSIMYTIAVLLCTKYNKRGMPFWPRLLVLLLFALPAYIVGIVLFAVFSVWLRDPIPCWELPTQFCSKIQAVEITTVLFSSLAIILSVVDALIVIKMHRSYKRLI